MNTPTPFTLTLWTALLIALALPAQAHNLWIIGDARGQGEVHLYFEHHVGPGDGSYNGPIVQRGRTWLKQPGADAVSLSLKEIQEGETRYLTGTTGPLSGGYSLDHTSLYGIYHGQLDFFHGRFIKADAPGDLDDLAESPNVPVQIIPVWTGKGLVLRIKYFRTPSPRADLWIIKSDGSEERLTADAKGEILLGRPDAGRHHYVTRIVEKGPAGAFEYEAYKGLMHGTSLTLELTDAFINATGKK